MKKKKSVFPKIIAIVLIVAILMGGSYLLGLKKYNDQKRHSNSKFSKAYRSSMTKIKGNGDDTVTILIYMNGSNLESDDGSATADITEMINAGYSDNVNVVIQTMGTKKWNKKYGIASNRSQSYVIGENGLELVRDNLGQLDSTKEKTLAEFISWGVKAYPADRYMLILWDHGGGPVYGFGYDEWQDDNAALTLDEIQGALKSCKVHFDYIGFDACIMSSLEVCLALYDYCDYAILSEDFEPGIGWHYTEWIKALNNNSSMKTTELGKIICDEMVKAVKKESSSESAILAIIDEGMMKVLYTAWTNFAYSNEDDLLNSNYSKKVKSSSRALPSMQSKFDLFGSDEDEVTLSEYYITDIMALASSMNTTESKALESALSKSIVYMAATKTSGLTGISVTLPYGDSEFYSALKTIFTNCGIDNTYVSWLKQFTSASGSSNYYDYDDWDDDWDGWDDYDDDYDWDDDDWDGWSFLFDWLWDDDWDDDDWDNWDEDDYDDYDDWDWNDDAWYSDDYDDDLDDTDDWTIIDWIFWFFE